MFHVEVGGLDDPFLDLACLGMEPLPGILATLLRVGRVDPEQAIHGKHLLVAAPVADK